MRTRSSERFSSTGSASISPIARGGMGKVYLGEQTRMKRPCAVKVLDPRFAAGVDAADFTRRFLLEASIASKLTHPHVVTIFDYGETPDGCFIAMEYLVGRSVSEELREGRPARAGACHPHREAGRSRAPRGPRARRRAPRREAGQHLPAQAGRRRRLRQGARLRPRAREQDERRERHVERRHHGVASLHGARTGAGKGDRRAAPTSTRSAPFSTRCSRAIPPFERRTELATMMAQVSDPPPPMSTVGPTAWCSPRGSRPWSCAASRRTPTTAGRRWRTSSRRSAIVRRRRPSGRRGREPTRRSRRASPARPRRPQRARSGTAGTLGVAALFAIATVLVGVALFDRPPPAAPAASASAQPIAAPTVSVAPVAPQADGHGDAARRDRSSGREGEGRGRDDLRVHAVRHRLRGRRGRPFGRAHARVSAARLQARTQGDYGHRPRPSP